MKCVSCASEISDEEVRYLGDICNRCETERFENFLEEMKLENQMPEEKTVCNKENGCMSNLWDRKCWVADSFASLISSHIETLGEKYGEILKVHNDPDSPFWKLIEELEYYCEELRVKNGLRHPDVLNKDEKFPAEIDA